MHRLLVLDFETHYSREYSLTAMPPPAYILDTRFECICCGVKEDDNPTPFTVDGPDFPRFLAKYDPNTTTTVTFNALFDNCILAYRYGFVPKRMLDAMGMARALLGHELTRFSLDAVSKHLQLGSKTGALPKVIGMRRDQIMAHGLWREFCDYAANDAGLCAAIFDRLLPMFPASEQRVMDLVLRCAVQPRFHIDRPMLSDHLKQIIIHKGELLAKAGVVGGDVMSADKFKVLLEAFGVPIEYKTSPSGRSVPAFAKTDRFMADLLEHENPSVQALAAARLGLKSTIEETRAKKLLEISELPWSVLPDGNLRLYSGGTMPVPLRYGGAHTHRLSGDWGMNMQNMPTERGSKGASKLRKALVAPPHHKVIVTDLGQIEARLVAWICGQDSLLEQFRQKLDPYAIMASHIFNMNVNPTLHKVERFIGKTAILGLGYGCGAVKFDSMVVTSARMQGLTLGSRWDSKLAQTSVEKYRTVNYRIKHSWSILDNFLTTAWLGKGPPKAFGPVTISKGRVDLPNGLALQYDAPRVDPETNDLLYNYGRFTHKIYGAKLLENIVQALARIVVMNAALRIADRGYKFVLQAHDELVFIVHESEVDKAKEIIHTEMVRPPSWAKNIPLTADMGVGGSYGEAK